MFYIDNSIKSDTRYDWAKFLEFDMDNFDVLSSFMMLNIPLLPVQGIYTITNPQKRPDMLSYQIYKSTQFWWILMWYNAILTVDELVTGKTIKYFNLGQLEQLYTDASIYAKVSKRQ